MSAKHKGHTVIIYSTPPTKQIKKKKKKKNSLQSHTPFQHILPAQMDASVIDMREKIGIQKLVNKFTKNGIISNYIGSTLIHLFI